MTKPILQELIESEIIMDYSVYDFGTMINGIAGHYPKEYGASFNYFYQIQVDGIASDVGISDIDYEKDMVISFVETSTLSEFDQRVDDFIYTFINDELETYLNDDGVDYMVTASLKQLVDNNYILLNFDEYYTFSNLSSVDELDLLSTGELLKIGIPYFIENGSLDTYKNTVLDQTIDNPYAAIAYLEALYLTSTKDEQAANSLMTQVVDKQDFAGMSLLALSPYSDLNDFAAYLESTTNYIKTNLTPTGVQSWGASNSSSTSTVILGLVAQGVNPQDVAYQVDGIGLVEALMLYQVGNGFKWKLSDENIDDMFSTPQAFAALVAYKLSRDVWGFPSTNIFDLNQA